VRRLRRSWFDRDATEVAPDLLNKLLVHGPCVGRIAEVEAYREDDPASHSFRGPTMRNASMFGRPGLLYVYLIYGMHHCANVVTGPVGSGQAVLIRAVLPVAGVNLMRERRDGRPDLADGPAKLCRAFGLDRSHDGVDLCAGSGLAIVDDGSPPPDAPVVGGRIGITRGTTLPWRWRLPERSGAQPSGSAQWSQ
jgi:DNA-3-methyladenine glycosylase